MSRFGALGFGLVVTAIELAVVAAFNQPRAHPDEQTPEPTTPAPVVVATAPPRQSAAYETAAALANTPTETPVAPLLTPTALPALADDHPGLIGGLPGLAGQLPGLRVPTAPPPPPSTEPDQSARAMRRPPARYPSAARRQGIEGSVVLRLRIDEAGRVVEAVVVSADPAGVFDDAALAAARRYVFAPARRGGAPVPATLEQRVVFRLR